ncbi:hypothetical protein K8R43_06635 [archaeon]|nr:hypothetical protein [archaeon]
MLPGGRIANLVALLFVLFLLGVVWIFTCGHRGFGLPICPPGGVEAASCMSACSCCTHLAVFIIYWGILALTVFGYIWNIYKIVKERKTKA